MGLKKDFAATGYSNVSHCDDGFVLDFSNGLCYLVLQNTMDYDDVASSPKGCYKYGGDVLTFEADDQLKAFLKLLDSGTLTTYLLKFLNGEQKVKDYL